MTKKNPNTIILIDGVVGAGKTTIATLVAQKTNLQLYEELSNNDTFELLNRFYKDQERWSFTLQIHFLNERFRMIKQIHKNGSGILDRSIFGDKIFASMLNEDGQMSDEEYRTYYTLLDNMLEHSQAPDILIYLQCSTDVAIERINKRNRGDESGVPRAYWDRLNEKYETWYKDYVKSPKIILNVDNLDIQDEDERNKFLKQIENKLKEIKYI